MYLLAFGICNWSKWSMSIEEDLAVRILLSVHLHARISSHNFFHSTIIFWLIWSAVFCCKKVQNICKFNRNQLKTTNLWNLFQGCLILAEKQQPKSLKSSYWNYFASFNNPRGGIIVDILRFLFSFMKFLNSGPT